MTAKIVVAFLVYLIPLIFAGVFLLAVLGLAAVAGSLEKKPAERRRGAPGRSQERPVFAVYNICYHEELPRDRLGSP